MSRTVCLADESATEDFGRVLAAALPRPGAGWLVLLHGELGAGKSSLARAMLRSLGHTGTVPSPTYALVEPYELPDGPVYHVDLYRIADPDELEFLGWADLAQGLTLVEWPERAPAIREQADLEVALDYAGRGRHATVTALSARAEPVVAALADATVTS